MSAKKPSQIPAGSNPLAKTLARYLIAVREGRGLSQRKVAEQLGIPYGYYLYIEKARVIPRSRELQRRILDWLKGVSYEGAAPPVEAVQELRLKKNLKLVKTYLEPWKHRKLKQKAMWLGLSIAEVTHIALDRLLSDDGSLKSLKAASDQIHRTRIAQILAESPELRDVLDFEIKEAIRNGKKLIHYNDPEKMPTAPTSSPLADELDMTPDYYGLEEEWEEL